jgi:hypothetical protein
MSECDVRACMVSDKVSKCTKRWGGEAEVEILHAANTVYEKEERNTVKSRESVFLVPGLFDNQ